MLGAAFGFECPILASPVMGGMHGGMTVVVVLYYPPHSPSKSAFCNHRNLLLASQCFPFCVSFQPCFDRWRCCKRPQVASFLQVLGFAHSSISFDFRIHEGSVLPCVCFGSFLDVLIRFGSPWQAQVSHEINVLSQRKVSGRKLEVAGQEKANRIPKLLYLPPSPPKQCRYSE